MITCLVFQRNGYFILQRKVLKALLCLICQWFFSLEYKINYCTCTFLQVLSSSAFNEVDFFWQVFFAGHRLQVTGNRSQVTGRRLQVTGHRCQVTGQITTKISPIEYTQDIRRMKLKALHLDNLQNINNCSPMHSL